MKHKRSGFTLVEVMLFLGISGLLLMGIFVMTQSSISSQRFNDATQNFAEFLRGVYSETANPQSAGEGRSEMAIYGKLVTFGETVGLDGEKVPDDVQKIFAYDVVGNASSVGTGNATALLLGAKANVIMATKDASNADVLKPAGIVEEYIPRWLAVIDSTTNGSPYKGTIIMVRHSRSSMVTVLVSDKVLEVNKTIKTATTENAKSLLTNALEAGNFSSREINFCINMDGYGIKDNNIRSNVRIIKDARNSSGIEIIDLDSEKNACR